MAKSKFFRVATEGDTTDGRKIERSWIQDMADGYDPKKYAARVNLEHIRGVSPQGPFKAYGDVTGVKAQPVEDGKLGLFAQIDPTADLVTMNHARQKLFTSVEVSPNFANSGKAYMVGLAVTDSPASLGTDMLSFAASKPDLKLFEARKLDAANLFTASAEFKLELEPEVEPAQPIDFGAMLAAAFSKLTGQAPAAAAAQPAAIAPAAETKPDFSALQASITEAFNALGKRFDDARKEDLAAIGRLTSDFATLKTSVETTAKTGGGDPRKPATGGDGSAFTATDF